MKINFLKMSIIAIATLLTISCSKDEKTSTSETTQTSNTTAQTWAKFTVRTPANVLKPNYIVMMFDQPFTTVSNLPTIIKQVTTDSSGYAYFDLNAIVTSTTSKKYYFEVFTQTGTTYTLKTIYTRFDNDFSKGSNLETTLLVN